jgi:hypothetical protein
MQERKEVNGKREPKPFMIRDPNKFHETAVHLLGVQDYVIEWLDVSGRAVFYHLRGMVLDSPKTAPVRRIVIGVDPNCEPDTSPCLSADPDYGF